MTQPRDEATARARERLGAALRRVRQAAALTTRQVPKGQAGRYYTSAHISLVESGATPPSPELIDAYVGIGGDSAELRALYKQAEAAATAAGRRRRSGMLPILQPPQEGARVADRDEVQQHYVVIAQDVRYGFNPDGAIRDVLVVARLRARTPQTRLFYVGYTYPADPRPGVLSIEPLGGAVLDHLRESDTGMIAAYLKLDRGVDPDDSQAFTFSFRVHVDSTIRAVPRLRYFADAGTERLMLSAAFPAEAEPKEVWWFGARDIIDAENSHDGRELSHDGSGGYERTFDDLIPGWCYGFAWNWATQGA